MKTAIVVLICAGLLAAGVAIAQQAYRVQVVNLTSAPVTVQIGEAPPIELAAGAISESFALPTADLSLSYNTGGSFGFSGTTLGAVENAVLLIPKSDGGGVDALVVGRSTQAPVANHRLLVLDSIWEAETNGLIYLEVAAQAGTSLILGYDTQDSFADPPQVYLQPDIYQLKLYLAGSDTPIAEAPLDMTAGDNLVLLTGSQPAAPELQVFTIPR